MAFIPYSTEDGRVPAWEYYPATGLTPKKGMTLNLSGGKLVAATGTGKPQFVCIEPWHSIPSAQNGDHKWEHKPAAATVAPGENWSTTLSMTFQR